MRTYHFGNNATSSTPAAVSVPVPQGGVIRVIDIESWATASGGTTGQIYGYAVLMTGQVGVSQYLQAISTSVQTNVLGMVSISYLKVGAADPIPGLQVGKVITGLKISLPVRGFLTLYQFPGSLLQLLTQVTVHMD